MICDFRTRGADAPTVSSGYGCKSESFTQQSSTGAAVLIYTPLSPFQTNGGISQIPLEVFTTLLQIQGIMDDYLWSLASAVEDVRKAFEVIMER